MRFPYFIPALALLTLTACGGSKEDSQVTETRMDDLDSLEGTISDDMINSDESTDEAPVEAAVTDPTATKMQEPKAKLDKTQSKETGGPDIVKIDPASETQ